MSRQHILPSWVFLNWPSLLGLAGFASPLFRFAGGLEGALLYLLLAIHIGQGDWICPGLVRLCCYFSPKINRLSFPPFKLHSLIGRREPCES
jgi:hypothetical protein